MSVTRALFRCDGADVPPPVATLYRDAEKQIHTRGPSPSLTLSAQSLAETVVAQVGARAADLVRIASYVCAADQEVSRGGQADPFGDRWRRRITMCIPVSEPSFWNQERIRSQLAQVLSFLTDDTWEFHFSCAPPEYRQINLDVNPATLLGEPDSVVLLSGGADSLCTAVEAAAVEGRRPILVSHRAAPSLDARQYALAEGLRGRVAEWGFPHLSFWIHRMRSQPADSSQRSRAFLYACLGAAVASETGVSHVLLGDNGIVSLNLPFSAQLVGALASRSTHPKFIRLFNEFITEALPNPARLSNPLEFRTRAETLGVLSRTGTAQLLQETNSCSRARGLPSATPHCGYCSQCVDRRFGSIAAELEEHDLPERYVVDIFAHTLPEGEARTVAESYVRFARDVRRTSEEELFYAYPQLGECIDPSDPSPHATAVKLVGMLKRHADAVVGTMSRMVSRHSEDLVMHAVQEDSLIRLEIGATPKSTPTEDTRNVFLKEGRMWTLAFRGRTVSMDPLKGLDLIARLLERPNQEVSAVSMVLGDEADTGSLHPQGGRRIGAGELAAEGLSWATAGADQILDREAMVEYRGQIARLQTEHESALSVSDTARVESIGKDIADLQKALSSASALGVRTRKFRDADERARNNVSKNIHRALNIIRAYHPDLGHHLHNSLRIGVVCSYTPESPTSWLT